MRRHKFNAVRTEVDGIKFASKKEANRYQTLKLYMRAQAISALELQPKFDLVVNGLKICKYVADFRYLNIKGEYVIEDAKGMKTPIYKLKKKLVKALHGIDIKEV